MADLPPLLEPSAHGLCRHDPPGGRVLSHVPGVPDLAFVLTAVVHLHGTRYCEWHWMGPPETPEGDVLQIQELGRVRARRVGPKKVEVATCAFLQVVDGDFGSNMEAAVQALRACNAQSGWEIVNVGEF
jgi:hypothetical protein